MLQSFKFAIVSAAMLCATSAIANNAVTLQFEGLKDGEAVDEFYDGGLGGSDNIHFSLAAHASVDTVAGGTGHFSNNPSGHTIVTFGDSPSGFINVFDGFTAMSLFHSNASAVKVFLFDQLAGTGNILASFTLDAVQNPFDNWVPNELLFHGVAKSVSFVSDSPMGFDDISFAIPAQPGGAVPEPASWALMLGGFGLVGGVMRSAKRKAVIAA